MTGELLAEVMIWLMGIGLVAALSVVAWSVVTFLRRRGQRGMVVNHVPSRRIALVTALSTAVLPLLSFAFASTASLSINGQAYTGTLWLRMADMFIVSSAVLMLAALVAVCISMFKKS